MHLEVRVEGKRRKYYLAYSFRRGKKVRKIRVYLGSNLSKRELAERRRKAEKKIREHIKRKEVIHDPYISVLLPSEIEELRTLEAKGKMKVLHLSETDWAIFTKAFTYNTNAIEGSRVDAREVAEILEKRKWPEGRTKEEIAETYGVAEAIEYIRKVKEHISLNLIKRLHKMVFKNSKHFAGEFRGRGVEVVIADRFGNIVHRGASSGRIKVLLKELVGWYAKNKNKHPPLVLAAVVHNQFENIHPFQDGNGRVGRLLLNNILIKHNLPPLNIELKNSGEYYAALQAYEKDHNIRPTIELMLKEYRALKRMLRKR